MRRNANRGTLYAKGNNAWGVCQRSGFRYKLRELVNDGRFPHLLVHPSHYDPPDAQETLTPIMDAYTLQHPSPELTRDAEFVTFPIYSIFGSPKLGLAGRTQLGNPFILVTDLSGILLDESGDALTTENNELLELEA